VLKKSRATETNWFFSLLISSPFAKYGTMLLGRLSHPFLTIKGLFASTSNIHTSAAIASWGGGKLKTHTGTAKRFKPVGKRRGNITKEIHYIDTADGIVASPFMSVAPTKYLGTMFKRGQTGKRHLNSKMSHSQGARLRGTKIHESGHTIRTLNRLIGSHF
jgi:ribosomal protein L35